ncbi:MAG TPA: hypothetical protein VF796_20380, partial [Humisphaera sp.]
NGEKWIGTVVASPEAIYLVKHMSGRTVQKAGVAAGMGGIVGAAIASLMPDAPVSAGRATECAYGELPPSVRLHPQWPVPQRFRRIPGYDRVRVVVVPRSSVTGVRHKSFSNLMGVRSSAVDRLTIDYFPFTGGRKRRCLKAFGYPVE